MLDIIIIGNLINECPITHEDVLSDENIFGPSMSGIKGRSIRKTPNHVDTYTINQP